MPLLHSESENSILLRVVRIQISKMFIGLGSVVFATCWVISFIECAFVHNTTNLKVLDHENTTRVRCLSMAVQLPWWLNSQVCGSISSISLPSLAFGQYRRPHIVVRRMLTSNSLTSIHLPGVILATAHKSMNVMQTSCEPSKLHYVVATMCQSLSIFCSCIGSMPLETNTIICV